uniref:phosphatidylglycerol lysyltransferase domain-containing protein n=1 Tax=Mariniflexile sp. TaxID=1979402 RepID=UPI004048AB3D
MKKTISIFKSNRKLILQIALGLLSVFLGIYFFRHERSELAGVKNVLYQADLYLMLWGTFLSFVFVWVQGLMYQYSFKAIQQEIPIKTAILLFLKRNFISVFLPGGMVTNMFFFNKDIEKKQGISRTLILYASTLFSICSVASSIVVLVPALILLLLKGGLQANMVYGMSLVVLVTALLVFITISIFREGVIYKVLEKKSPSFILVINNLKNYTIDKKQLSKVLVFSIVIEIIGVYHLYISMMALGSEPSIIISIIGYALVLLILLSSPFLKGIGAIELALTYSLTLFGLSAVTALSVALLFRFFEFWSIFILGFFTLIFRKDNVLFRVFPAFLLFVLGLINILSSITPTLPDRFKLLKHFLPIFAIDASIWLILFSGAFMLVVAIFLIKGLRNAWFTAMLLTALSLIAHLTKGIDWEEAILALITLCSLLYTRKQYFIKNDRAFANQTWFTAIVTFVSVLIFGTIGFYFMERHHFNADFSLWESFEESVSSFFLLNVDLMPTTSFAKVFLFGMHVLGVLTMGFWGYLFLKPYIIKQDATVGENYLHAKQLLEKYGSGSLDYFKVYPDKQFWFNASKTAFVSYKISGSYAIVLENPVAEDTETLKKSVVGFDAYCKTHALRKAFYRVPESDIEVYKELNKKVMKIGAVAVVDLETFNLEGGDKKPLRNAFNKISKSGLLFKKYLPQQKEGFLQQLKTVSNEWLKDMEREEMLFSQGIFDENELKKQTIYTIESIEGKIYAFVNMIPSYKKGEANFDLMRKSTDAPNGTMDFLFINMFLELKQEGYKTCDLGMVFLSGIKEPQNIQERVIKVTYENIKRFSQYKNLYHFKEKYNPSWSATYLVYDDVVDLVFIPNALKNVMEV